MEVDAGATDLLELSPRPSQGPEMHQTMFASVASLRVRIGCPLRDPLFSPSARAALLGASVILGPSRLMHLAPGAWAQKSGVTVGDELVEACARALCPPARRKHRKHRSAQPSRIARRSHLDEHGGGHDLERSLGHLGVKPWN